MTLASDQVARLQAWGVDAMSLVDDHPFAWWAMRGEEYVVVKAGDPGERYREALALQAFGAGATDVIEHDRDLGLLVTRRVLPGDDIRPLARQDDDAATRAIALLAADLHRDQGTGSGLPPLPDIGVAFDAPHDDRLPGHLVDSARRVFDDLIAEPTPRLVLHGDLQHLNVLNMGEGWRAIDPHGWVGDPAFEAGPCSPIRADWSRAVTPAAWTGDCSRSDPVAEPRSMPRRPATTWIGCGPGDSWVASSPSCG